MDSSSKIYRMKNAVVQPIEIQKKDESLYWTKPISPIKIARNTFSSPKSQTIRTQDLMLQYAKHEKVTRNSSHLKPHYSHGNKKILKNQEKTSNNSPSLASKAPLKVPFMMLNEDIPSEKELSNSMSSESFEASKSAASNFKTSEFLTTNKNNFEKNSVVKPLEKYDIKKKPEIKRLQIGTTFEFQSMENQKSLLDKVSQAFETNPNHLISIQHEKWENNTKQEPNSGSLLLRNTCDLTKLTNKIGRSSLSPRKYLLNSNLSSAIKSRC